MTGSHAVRAIPSVPTLQMSRNVPQCLKIQLTMQIRKLDERLERRTHLILQRNDRRVSDDGGRSQLDERTNGNGSGKSKDHELYRADLQPRNFLVRNNLIYAHLRPAWYFYPTF